MAAMSIERAKALRHTMTDAERHLWRVLRGSQLDGHKFRRQAPVGPFIVDFVCFDWQLVVEVDGGQHAVHAEQDRQRTAWLESQGFTVVRFWNHEVLGNLEGVVGILRRYLQGAE